MRLLSASAAALWAIVPAALCQTAQYVPGDVNGISFRLNIPESTASSKSGPIYFQMQAPSSVQWFALGQGESMPGSNIFVIYSSSSSNVTISPRLGKGFYEPKYNKDAKVTLLEGTGIVDGKVTANVRCDSCLSWDGGSMDPSAPKSDWIWAMKDGSPLDTMDVSEDIKHHDNKGLLKFTNSDATGGNSDNPFKDMSPTPSPSSPSSGTSSSDTSDGNSTIDKKRIAHGVIMSVSFALLFPLFALSLYVVPYSKTVTRIHAPFQLFSLCLAIAGFGIGVSLARDLGKYDMYHPIIGYVVIACLVVFQPALGLSQHLFFRKTQRRGIYGMLHCWLGRTVLILGIVNGGLGFRFAGIGEPTTPRGAVIAYIVVAACVATVYGIVVLFSTFRKKGDTGDQGGSEPKPPENKGS